MKKILLLAVFTLALGACASSSPSSAPAGGGFTLPNINGTTFNSAADAQGKPLFIAFMATYCGYCKMSVPQIIELQKTYGPKGLKIVGVFSDDTKDGPAQYAQNLNINYDVLYKGGQVTEDFGVRGYPHFVLMDKDHNVVKTWGGYSPAHNFSSEIDKVL